MKKILMIASIISLYSSASFAKDQADIEKMPPRPPHHERPDMMKDKMFSKMDKDSNGSISKQEWVSFHEEHFDKADENKDGNLTRNELEKAHEKMRAKWHEMKEKVHDKISDVKKEHAKKTVELENSKEEEKK